MLRSHLILPMLISSMRTRFGGAFSSVMSSVILHEKFFMQNYSRMATWTKGAKKALINRVASRLRKYRSP